MTVRSRARRLTLRIESAGTLAVFEGSRRLWTRPVSAGGGGADAHACTHNDWGVVIAGHYRHGDDVFDLFTGDKLGPGDVDAYAPDLSFGLVSPQFGWAHDGCFQVSRTFRVQTDGSRRPYALDTIPVPGAWVCDTDAGEAQRLGPPDHPSVAIAPDGLRYAVASPSEIALFRSSDDALVGRLDRPPYDEKDRGTNATSLGFSDSGTYLILTHEPWVDGPDGSKGGEYWFRIEPSR